MEAIVVTPEADVPDLRALFRTNASRDHARSPGTFGKASPQEVEAIAHAGIHRVQYPHKHPGLAGIGLAVAVVCAALLAVLEELSESRGQRLIVLKGIDPSPGSRYVVCDPAVKPPKFWPELKGDG